MTTQALKDLIQLDMKYNRTPDLASLRFRQQAIPVFIWDDLQDDAALHRILGHKTAAQGYQHARGYFKSAMTVNEYVPWYNMSNEGETFPAYCLEEAADLCLLDVEDYMDTTKRPLSGRIYVVDLKTLIDLDIYYCNGEIFNRVEITCKPCLNSVTKFKVFSYFNDVDMIGTYVKDAGCYLLDEDIDPIQFTKRGTGKDTYYEM